MDIKIIDVKPTIRSMSTNARESFKNGEKRWCDWSVEDIIEEIYNMEEEDENLTLYFNPLNLKKYPADFVRKYFLKRESWHHINCEPVWMYKVSKKKIIEYGQDMNSLHVEVNRHAVSERKPLMAKVSMEYWGVTVSGGQRTRHFTNDVIIYNGYIYFAKGSRIPFSCENVSVIKYYTTGIPKNLRDKHRYIIRQMRNYNIYF